MKKVSIALLFFGTTVISFAQKPSASSLIDQVRRKYAPDSRTAIFKVGIDSIYVVGKTNLPQAKKALLESLKANEYYYTDAIRVLPESEVGDESYGFINISVGNLRTGPKDPNELASQVLLGTPVRILEKDNLWYLIQTPDKYIAWIDHHAIKRMNKNSFDNYFNKEKLIYTRPFGFSYEKTDDNSQTVSDLVWGNLLTLNKDVADSISTDSTNKFYPIIYPDGRKAFVLKNEVKFYNDWLSSLDFDKNALVNSAKKMIGIPYLWGGTSFKGVDCSGFTRMIYQMNGLYLPRDASQQIRVGEPIDLSKGFESLQEGDLLFFGEKAHDDKSEKIVHVAIWIGNMQFIHSSGMVKIGSFDKNSPKFDAYNLGRFIRAKRVLGNQNSIVSLKSASIYQVNYTK